MPATYPNTNEPVLQENLEDVNIVGYINKGEWPQRRNDGGSWQRNANANYQGNHGGQSSSHQHHQKQVYTAPQLRQPSDEGLVSRKEFNALARKVDE